MVVSLCQKCRIIESAGTLVSGIGVVNMDEQMKNRINELKAQVFELIKQQEILRLQNQQIQDKKVRIVQEIQTLESLQQEDPKQV